MKLKQPLITWEQFMEKLKELGVKEIIYTTTGCPLQISAILDDNLGGAYFWFRHRGYHWQISIAARDHVEESGVPLKRRVEIAKEQGKPAPIYPTNSVFYREGGLDYETNAISLEIIKEHLAKYKEVYDDRCPRCKNFNSWEYLVRLKGKRVCRMCSYIDE